MPSVEERLAHVEGRLNEQSQLFAMIRDALASLEGRVDRRFDAIDRRFEAVENELQYHFRWTIGIQVTMFALIVGGLVAMLTR